MALANLTLANAAADVVTHADAWIRLLRQHVATLPLDIPLSPHSDGTSDKSYAVHELRAMERDLGALADALKVNPTPAFDLITHLHRQRAFSERTFGPGARTAGVCDHIRKELKEIEAAPSEITEWVDVILLALDGAWRSGATPEQIAEAIDAKQTRNEGRNWPDWRTADPGKAIEHVRTDPTPTKDDWLKACAAQFQARQVATSDDAWKLANACLGGATILFGSEEAALASSPEEAADEEISCWGDR